MRLFIRIILVVLGSAMLLKITGELLHGQIAYSIGDVVDESVTTKTFAEALAVWLAFGSLFVAMILAGAVPHWFIDQPWLWKVLIALIFGGYILGSLLR